MRQSKFSDEEKRNILKEKEVSKNSVEQICVKYGISIATFYKWNRDKSLRQNYAQESESELKVENSVLRRLYIELSEHNYQLAQFLNQ